VKRRVLLALLAATLLAVGVALRVANTGNESPIDASFAADNYPFVMPDLCEVRQKMMAGEKTAAYNVFYRRLHPTLHALSADVDSRGEEGRITGGVLRKAKARVEAGLLNPDLLLEDSLNSLIAATRSALQQVDADVSTSC
jgi:hypothetical protein